MSRTANLVKHIESLLVAQLKPVSLWPQAHHFLHYQELNLAQSCHLIIQDMYLHTLTQLAFECAIIWLEVYWAELHAWQLQCVQRFCQTVGIDPWCTHNLEWQGISYTNVHIPKLAKDSRHGVEYGRLALWHVWRSHNPLQSSLLPGHITLPTFHFHHVQIAFVLVVGCVQIQGQLAGRLTIYIRYLKLTHKRDVSIFHQVSFNFLAAERVWTI